MLFQDFFIAPPSKNRAGFVARIVKLIAGKKRVVAKVHGETVEEVARRRDAVMNALKRMDGDPTATTTGVPKWWVIVNLLRCKDKDYGVIADYTNRYCTLAIVCIDPTVSIMHYGGPIREGGTVFITVKSQEELYDMVPPATEREKWMALPLVSYMAAKYGLPEDVFFE